MGALAAPVHDVQKHSFKPPTPGPASTSLPSEVRMQHTQEVLPPGSPWKRNQLTNFEGGTSSRKLAREAPGG